MDMSDPSFDPSTQLPEVSSSADQVPTGVSSRTPEPSAKERVQAIVDKVERDDPMSDIARLATASLILQDMCTELDKPEHHLSWQDRSQIRNLSAALSRDPNPSGWRATAWNTLASFVDHCTPFNGERFKSEGLATEDPQLWTSFCSRKLTEKVTDSANPASWDRNGKENPASLARIADWLLSKETSSAISNDPMTNMRDRETLQSYTRSGPLITIAKQYQGDHREFEERANTLRILGYGSAVLAGALVEAAPSLSKASSYILPTVAAIASVAGAGYVYNQRQAAKSENAFDTSGVSSSEDERGSARS